MIGCGSTLALAAGLVSIVPSVSAFTFHGYGKHPHWPFNATHHHAHNASISGIPTGLSSAPGTVSSLAAIATSVSTAMSSSSALVSSSSAVVSSSSAVVSSPSAVVSSVSTAVTSVSAAAATSNPAADAEGYVLPVSGTASTTQFDLGSELSGGTACGVDALPNGATSTDSTQGGGPGYLYAAINQLAFGANPSVSSAGGPGGACGICYALTPVSSAGVALTAQTTTFMIVDECPAASSLSGGSHCDTCTTSEKNDMGQTWHFDIAADAMSTAQYNTFFNGVTDGSNWLEVQFEKVTCNGTANATPETKSWGCISGDCPNQDAATVCENTGYSKRWLSPSYWI